MKTATTTTTTTTTPTTTTDNNRQQPPTTTTTTANNRQQQQLPTANNNNRQQQQQQPPTTPPPTTTTTTNNNKGRCPCCRLDTHQRVTINYVPKIHKMLENASVRVSASFSSDTTRTLLIVLSILVLRVRQPSAHFVLTSTGEGISAARGTQIPQEVPKEKKPRIPFWTKIQKFRIYGPSRTDTL
jgi:hypothetical protein